MQKTTLAGLMVLLAACTDNRAASTIPTSSAAQKQRSQAADTRFGDARPAWSSLSDAEKAIAARTIERAAREQGDVHLQPQIVLLDNALPNRAVAVVLRNPGTPSEPIIVVQNSTADARTMERAFAALESLRRSHRSPAVRTLWINALGEITVSSTEMAAGARLSPASGTAQRTALGAQLARSAASTATIDLPGLGTGTVLRFH
ncbi:MAG TPA: hypothetical protein VF665_01015 [Longimicrobium sp.]|jgi:hypothetical protein|uniref:hypothetical protein n=1 Tax=Longimicrobium sp. TaxID=2029185 RepID=UPI002ED852C2